MIFAARLRFHISMVFIIAAGGNIPVVLLAIAILKLWRYKVIAWINGSPGGD
jgi:hypothetical protein